MLMAVTRRGFIALAAGLAMTAAAAAQTAINAVAFAPGFAWANLFGASGTEKTPELLAFEKKEGVTVNMEYGDEEAARQKVLLDLVNGTGKYDLVMLGSDGAVQTDSYSGYLEPLDTLVDWSKINSVEELRPYIAQRDDNYVRIIRDEIVARKKKALLIIGTGHIFGAAYLRNKLDNVNPGVLATVAPFTGYFEHECNAKFVARAKDWPVPAAVSPTATTSLKAFLETPGRNRLRKVGGIHRSSDSAPTCRTIGAPRAV